MDLTERENNLWSSLVGIIKSLASPVPVIGQVVAGYDSYKQSVFNRNAKKAIKHINEKVEDLPAFLESDWFQTEDGQQFSYKVFDAAIDAQLEDKQELFINALINGGTNHSISQLEKLKFVDMLRHMSRASLMVLAEMHKLFIGQVRGPNRQPDPIQSFPSVNATRLAEELSDKFHPYLINSAVSEMEGQGLFSTVGDWKKDTSGKYRQAGGFATELCYTDFAARFVDFITLERDKIK